ncbi:hypothetical protein C0036_18675, partial [Streptomyces sp. DJ]
MAAAARRRVAALLTVRPATRLTALLAVLAGAVALLLGGAAPASAHAALVSTDPARESVLAGAPRQVSLGFSESVLLSADSVRVLDPDGRRVDEGGARHTGGDARTASVRLRAGLPDGTFTVAWKAVSGDSHPVSGAFTFSVGAPSQTSAALPEQRAGEGAVGVLYDVARYVAYGGYALLVGTGALLVGCWHRGAAVRPVRRLLLGGWAAMLLSALALLLLRGPYTAGGGLGSAFAPG